MNIPDEYFTDEVPTDPGWYAVKWDDGGVSFEPMELPCHGEAWANWHRGCHFCRLAPAAEVERLRERVKRLEEAGDDMEIYIDNGLRLNDVTVAWNIAKEAKP